VKALFFSFLILISTAEAASQKFYISEQVFKNSKLSFQSHHGPGAFGSYLVMDVNFGPVSDVYKQLLTALKGVSLINRGEAHITIVTPVEYSEILKTKLSMTEIDDIAKKNKVQNSKFEVVCVGKGSQEINSKTEDTYFIVVRSPELLKIREDIQKLFVSKGGDKDFFKPQYFYPHITLGFTLRDLHVDDGVIKDESSCAYDLELKQ